MAHEDLMAQGLPKGIKDATKPGRFYVRDNHGSHSVIVFTKVIVTCGDSGASERADELASMLNEILDILAKKILN